MGTEVITYSRIGKQDLNLGIGTYEVILADGRKVMLDKVDLGAILADTALATPLPSTALSYTTGTWTPSVGGTATYTEQLGYYQKVGEAVTVSCMLTITAIGTGSTTTISGLPYAPKLNTTATFAVYFQSLSAAKVTVIGQTNQTATTVRLCSLGAAGTDLAIGAVITSGTIIYFSGSYLASL
jgi:hypothetical protein